MYYKVRVVQSDFRYRKVVKVIAQALELFSRNLLILMRIYSDRISHISEADLYISRFRYSAIYEGAGRLDNGEILVAAML